MENALHISEYLDSTYLKTAVESGVTEIKNREIVFSCIDEAITNKFACIMIRPEFVLIAVERIKIAKSKLKVGTVIDFPFGNSSTLQKIDEAKTAIFNGAYDIDFVCDYNAFKRGYLSKFDVDILECTKLCIDNKKIVKWIIETGALSKDEIIEISKRISSLVESNFSKNICNIFIKTSTGYYGGYGATINDIKLIKSVSKNLKIKASGGISCYEDAIKMISAGADRIGTSKAHIICNHHINEF